MSINTTRAMRWERYFLSTKGRINRKIFILYVIFVLLFGIVILYPSMVISIAVIMGGSDADSLGAEIVSTILSGLFQLALLPGLFLSVQRLHDLDKSPVYIFLYIIPLVNIVFLFYLLFAKGTDGDNRYGTNPLTNDIDMNDRK